MSDVFQGKLHCRFCDDFIGFTKVPVLWTGSVDHPPFYPDGLEYRQCERCGLWHRLEILPPDHQQREAEEAA